MNENELLARIDAFTEANTEALVADIAALVAIRSVSELPLPGAPFGAGCREVLDAALAMARRMGLETHADDGYLGWAQLPGREEGHLATISHLDIVPEGEGWDGDPLVLRRQEGWLLGRGVADDKGPSVLCLYAAKFLAEEKLPLRYGLRVLLGCSEETGMADVAHYLETNPQPLFCFSPDSDFPVCNGEKGVYGGRFISGVLHGKLVDFNGGVAGNVIPSRASCTLRHSGAAPAATARVRVSSAGKGLLRLEAQGIGGHAAHPDGSLNAIGLLVDYLLENKLCSPEEEQWLQLLRRLHSATDGSGLGIACSDDKFTPLTCIGGEIEALGGETVQSDGREAAETGLSGLSLVQSINIRYPTSTNEATLTEMLSRAAEAAGGHHECVFFKEPFYIPANSRPIAALMEAYELGSGRAGQPYTMGGGTYARYFASAVAFGPQPPQAQRPAFAGPEHGANEGSSLAALLQALKVYILALWKLQDVDF